MSRAALLISVSLELLKKAVKKAAGSIYRIKGVALSIEAPDRRVILQTVGKRVDVAMEEPWGTRTPRTRVVAIGAKGALDESSLEAIFKYSDEDQSLSSDELVTRQMTRS